MVSVRVCAVTLDNRRTSNRLMKNQLQLDQGFDGEPISAAANATKTASTMCRMAVLISWRQLATFLYTFFIFFHVGPVSPQHQQHNSQEFLNELSEIKWLKHLTLHSSKRIVIRSAESVHCMAPLAVPSRRCGSVNGLAAPLWLQRSLPCHRCDRGSVAKDPCVSLSLSMFKLLLAAGC